MRLEQLLLVITNEGLLASVKVFCDWMSCNKAIIATCAKVGGILMILIHNIYTGMFPVGDTSCRTLIACMCVCVCVRVCPPTYR